MNFKIFVLSLILLLIISFIQSLTYAQRIECNDKRTYRHLDTIFQRMYTFGHSGREFPYGLKQSKIYCNETLELLKTAERYVKKCLEEYPKQLLTVLVNTIRSQSRSLCGKDSKRLQELFSSSSCINAAKDDYQKCINSSVDALIGIKFLSEDKQKIPLLCCGNHRLQECFHDESTKYKVCTEEKIENSLRFLDSIQGNMMSILCSNPDDSSDTCDKLVYPKRPKNIRRTQSIVMPIVDILNSIKD